MILCLGGLRVEVSVKALPNACRDRFQDSSLAEKALSFGSGLGRIGYQQGMRLA